MQSTTTQQPPSFIFLNVGGVLTNAASAWTQGEDRLDTTALRLIEKLCKGLGTKVVMATSRVTRFPTASSWCELFKEYGADIPVVDVLPDDQESWWDKADTYMSSHHGSRWVVLTDGITPPHLYEVLGINRAVGLTLRDLEIVAKILAPDSDLYFDLRRLNKGH